jgi:hypothetical protein
MAAASGRELILEAVKDRLAEIKEASGYHTTPVWVKREMPLALGELEVNQMPALYVIDGLEEREAQPSQQVECVFHISIHGYTYEPVRGSTELNQLLRDVKECLQAQAALGAGNWESGRGQGVRALIESVETDFDRETGHAVFVADLVVHYREPLVLA